jgi:hypothetical protein
MPIVHAVTVGGCRAALNSVSLDTLLNRDVNGIIAEYAVTPAIQWRLSDSARSRKFDPQGIMASDGRSFRKMSTEMCYLESKQSLEHTATKWSIEVTDEVTLQIGCLANGVGVGFGHFAWTQSIGQMPGQITTFGIDLVGRTISVTRDGMDVQTVKWATDEGDLPSRCYARIFVWGTRSATLTFSYSSVFLFPVVLVGRCHMRKP